MTKLLKRLAKFLENKPNESNGKTNLKASDTANEVKSVSKNLVLLNVLIRTVGLDQKTIVLVEEFIDYLIALVLETNEKFPGHSLSKEINKTANTDFPHTVNRYVNLEKEQRVEELEDFKNEIVQLRSLLENIITPEENFRYSTAILSQERQDYIKNTLNRIRQVNPAHIIAREEREKFSITNLKNCGIIRFRSNTYFVDGVGEYTTCNKTFTKKKKYKWPEVRLCCLNTGESINLEWEGNNTIEVSMTECRIDFRHIYDEYGRQLNQENFKKIILTDSDSVYLKRPNEKEMEFWHDENCFAIFSPQDNEKEERVWILDLESSGDRNLTIEKWHLDNGELEFQIFLSQNINPKEIEIISLGGG